MHMAPFDLFTLQNDGSSDGVLNLSTWLISSDFSPYIHPEIKTSLKLLLK